MFEVGVMKMHPWQLDILDKIATGGFKRGEMAVTLSGRQMGKSTWRAMVEGWDLATSKISFQNAGKAEVDGELWYTVKCNNEIGKWIRSLPKEGNWYEHIDNQFYVYANMFDLHERVYVQLGLKFDQ